MVTQFCVGPQTELSETIGHSKKASEIIVTDVYGYNRKGWH